MKLNFYGIHLHYVFVLLCKLLQIQRLQEAEKTGNGSWVYFKTVISLLILKSFLVSFLLIVLIKSLNYFNIHWNILNWLFCHMTSACLNDSMLIKFYWVKHFWISWHGQPSRKNFFEILNKLEKFEHFKP